MRNLDITIFDDARSTQSLDTGDDPLWATVAWTDFTGPSAEYHSVEYTRDSGRNAIVRSETVEGIAQGPEVKARFLDNFGDADIRLTGDSVFLLKTSLNPEVDTPLGSQARTGDMVGYLRPHIEPVAPAGGYAIFSTGPVTIKGGDNAIVGHVYSSGDIMFSGPNNHVFGIVETTIGFSTSLTTSFFWHNDPTPPTGDTPSHEVLLMDELDSTETTLHNYDTDRDTAAGLLILKGGSGVNESDLTKSQVWRTDPVVAELELESEITIDCWSAIQNFQLGSGGAVTIFLRDRDSFGNYTEIDNGTITDPDWQAGTADFVQKTITIPAPLFTVQPGHEMVIKLIVPSSSSSNIWLAYDTTSYQSALKIRGGASLKLVAEFFNTAAFVKPIPVTYSTGDFLPFAFDFVGDVDLEDRPEVWADPQHTQLNPGVYHATGTVTLVSNQPVTGNVTIIGTNMNMRSKELRLTAFRNGTVIFSTGSVAQGQSTIALGSRLTDTTIIGLIYAPNGEVSIRGTAQFHGSVFTNGLSWGERQGRIIYNPDIFQE